MKAILKSLGSSMYKDTFDFLDRIKERDWDKITLPIAVGDITVMRIVIL